MKNSAGYILVLIFVLSSTSIAWAKEKDSILIESLFNDLLKGNKDSVEVYTETARLEKKLDVFKRLNWLIYNEAKYYLFSGKPEKAAQLAKNAICVLHVIDSKKSLIKFYTLLGSSYSFRQDYQNGIFYFKKSLELAEQAGMELQVAYLHNNIANVFFSLLDFEAAHQHAEAAITILEYRKEDPNYASILAILSVSKAKIGDFELAEKLALEARSIAGEQSNYMALIIAIHALGEIDMNRANYEEAYAYYYQSLALAERFQLSHFVLLNSIGLLNASIESRLFTEAVVHGERALEIASQVKNNSTLYSINRHLARAYEGVGNYEKAFNLSKEAHQIYLETNKKETQEAINDLLIQYDTEKKEKEITAARLKLLASDIQTSRLLNLLMFIGFLLLIGGIGFLIYRTRTRERIYRMKAKNRKELFNALIRGEERERKRMGNELHDGLASHLIGIKYRLETDAHLPSDFKQDIVQKINIAHSETRRIAHNLAPTGLEEYGLLIAIEQFAKDNSRPGLVIDYAHVGNPNVLLNKNTELILFRIVQELVQNALKHAKANSIFIQTSFDGKMFTLQVENDGVGFNPANTSNGNGLKSVANRLKFLNASFSIDSSEKSSGAVAYISLPLSN